MTIRDLKKAVQEAGYQVLEVKEEDIVEKERLAREAELFKLKRKFIIGAVLLVPILILMYGGSLLEKWIGLSMETNFFHPISIGHSCPILGRLAVLCWVLEGDQA